MSFLNPLFLLGLLAVSLPIIIHLINLHRPQKIAFSTLSFFNELRKSTIRRLRIKQYLLLALRIIAILLLALALARPFLPPTLIGTSSSTGEKSVAILVDNSASMNRVGSDGPLMDQAKEIISQIIQNGNSNDKFLLRTTNISPLTNTGFMSSTQALTRLDDLVASDRAHYTLQEFSKAYQQLASSPEQESVLYIISDGQASQLSTLENFEFDESNSKSVAVQLIKVGADNTQNMAVQSIELKSQMLSPDATVTLAAEVENTGDAALANQYVSLEIEGETTGQYETSLEPGESKTFLFDVVPENVGYISGQIVLEGDEVSFDNKRNFVIHIPDNRSILLVDGNTESSSFSSYISPAITAAQQNNARLTFDKKQFNEIEQGVWDEYDGVVFDGVKEIPEYWHQQLRRYVQDGGGIVFFPSEQGNIESYNQFFALLNTGRFDNVVGEYGSFESITKLGELEDGHPILNDVFEKKEDEPISVDLPSLFYYFHYQSSGSAVPLLTAANDDPLLVEHSFGDGVLITSTIGADPGWSNFPVNPLFAPLFYRTILYAASPEAGGLQQHQLGTEFEWQGEVAESDLKLLLNGIEYAPDVQRQADGVLVTAEGQEWEPGMLIISSKNENIRLAVNQHIMESHFETLPEQQWQNLWPDGMHIPDVIAAENLSSNRFDEQLRAVAFGKEIWNWFIWIALLFLVTETLVSRLYKAKSTA